MGKEIRCQQCIFKIAGGNKELRNNCVEIAVVIE